MTVINRIGSWSYEIKNIFPKYRQAFRIANGWIQFIPFRDSRMLERVFEKTMFYTENGNAVYIS